MTPYTLNIESVRIRKKIFTGRSHLLSGCSSRSVWITSISRSSVALSSPRAIVRPMRETQYRTPTRTDQPAVIQPRALVLGQSEHGILYQVKF